MLKEKSRWFSLKMIYWAGDWLDHTCRQWDGDWKTSCQTLLTSASSRWRSSNWGLVTNINFQARNKYGWSQASKMFSFQTLSHTYTSEYVGVLCVVPPIFIVSISTVWSQTLNDFSVGPGLLSSFISSLCEVSLSNCKCILPGRCRHAGHQQLDQQQLQLSAWSLAPPPPPLSLLTGHF